MTAAEASAALADAERTILLAVDDWARAIMEYVGGNLHVRRELLAGRGVRMAHAALEEALSAVKAEGCAWQVALYIETPSASKEGT